MSDTFNHELDAFEDAFNRGAFITPQDVDNYPNIPPLSDEPDFPKEIK
jgi:hypothetical protein